MVSMSSVWDRTAEFLSDNLRAVFTIAAVSMFVPTAVSAIVQQAAVGAGPGVKLIAAVLAVVLALVTMVGQLAIAMLAIDPLRDPRGTLGAAGRRLPALIGVSLALGAALIVAFLPLVILLGLDGFDPTAMEGGAMPPLSGASIAAIVLYLLVGLPVLCWLGARLAVVTPIVAVERRGLGAIAHGYRMTRGHAGRIFGILLLIVVVGGVVALAVKLVVGTVLRLAIGGGSGFDWALALTAVAAAIVSTALSVTLTAFVAKLYVALAARSEAAANP